MKRTRFSKRTPQRMLAGAAMLSFTPFATSLVQGATFFDTYAGGGADNGFFTTGNWTAASGHIPPQGAASNVSSPASGTVGTDEIISNFSDATNRTINYDSNLNPQGASFNDFLLSSFQNTGTGTTTFNLMSAAVEGGTQTIGSEFVVRNSSSTFGQNSIFNVIDNSAFYNTSSSAALIGPAASGAVVNVNNGTFDVINTNASFEVGSAGYGTLNVNGGTLQSGAIESNGTTNASNNSIGLRVGDWNTGASTGSAGGVLNMNSGVGTMNAALIIGMRDLSSVPGTTSAGTMNMSGGSWTDGGAGGSGTSIPGGDVLIGWDVARGTTVDPFGSATGNLSISGGTFLINNSRQMYVGASNAIGSLNLSATGNLGTVTSPIAGVNIGASFDYHLNVDPGDTAGNADGPTDGAGTAYIAGEGTFNMTGGTAYITNLNVGTLAGTDSSTGSSVQGEGTFNLSGGTATVTSIKVAAKSVFNMSGGTLSVGTVTNAGSLTVSNGTLSITSSLIDNGAATFSVPAVTVGSLAGTGSIVLNNAGGTALTSGTTGNPTFSGTISDNGTFTSSGSLTVTGSGSLTLSGTSTYFGSTNVSGGTLNLAGALTNSATINLTGTSNLVLAGASALPSSAIVSVGSLAGVVVNNAQTISAIVSAGNATFTAGTSIVGQGSGIGTGTGTSGFAGGITGTGNLSVSGTANLYASTIAQNLLTVGSASTVTVADSAAPGNTAATSVLTDITNAGTLDLNNNDLIVLDTAQYSTVKNLIVNSYDGGAWDQPGITSSSARANPGSYGLGYAQASNIGSTSFDGQTFTDAVLVKYTLLGDTQLRGTVGLGDYNTVLSNFGTSQDWSGGDFHYGGVVGLGDYDAVLSNYGAHASGNLAVGPSLTRSISRRAASTRLSPRRILSSK